MTQCGVLYTRESTDDEWTVHQTPSAYIFYDNRTNITYRVDPSKKIIEEYCPEGRAIDCIDQKIYEVIDGCWCPVCDLTSTPTPTYDPNVVTAQTAIMHGFTPWYDCSESSVVSIRDGVVHLDNGGDGIAGMNLPIPRGASLSVIDEISWVPVAPVGRYERTTIRIEAYLRGGIFEVGSHNGDDDADWGTYRNDYTTFYYTTPEGTTSDVNPFDNSTLWRITDDGALPFDNVIPPTPPATHPQLSWGEIISQIRSAALPDGTVGRERLNAAIILAVSIGTNSSDGTNTQFTARFNEVTIKLTNSDQPVTYTFK